MTTVYGVLPEIKDYTPTTLYLYNEADGELINTGGDAVTKSGVYFSADVAESLVQCVARIDDATGQIWTGWMNASGVLSSQRAAELDSAVRVKLDATQPDYAPIRTGVEYQHTQNSAGVSTVNVTIEEA